MTPSPATAAMQIDRTGAAELTVTRSFAAPPERVWRALTTPALLQQWMWAYDWPMTECRMDLRPGGSFLYRYTNRDSGESFHFEGPILEVEAPHRMLHIERFNGDSGAEATVETRLIPAAAGTRMVMTMRYATAEALEQAMATGMTDGMDITYAKLDGLLAASED